MIIFDKVNKFILYEVDLHVPEGITLGIIGASGAGKTTFLKLISGLLEPQSGTVSTLRKNPVSSNKQIAARLSVLFADIPVFNDSLSILDNLDELRLIYGIEKSDFENRLDELSKRLDFSDILHSKPKSISLGQKRRAELGLTFLRD